MKWVELVEPIESAPISVGLEELLIKANELNLTDNQLETLRIKDYNGSMHTSPATLFSDSNPDKLAAITKRDGMYYLDWYKPIK